MFCSAGSDLVDINASFNWASLVLSFAFVIKASLAFFLGTSFDFSLTIGIETDFPLTFVIETQLVFLFISPISSLTLLLSFLFFPFDLLMDLKYLFICFSSNEALALFFLPSMFLMRSSIRSDPM